MSRFLGAIRQNGYVVRDIETAMRHWTERLGVGPFYYIERAPIEEYRYMGNRYDISASIALANSGGLQIELIEQRNDAPSMYHDFLEAGREGLQHVAYWTERMDEDLAKCEVLGFEIVQSGTVGADGRFVYFDTEGHPGTVVELSEVSGMKGEFFRHIRQSASQWDGTNAIVRVDL